MSWRTEGSVGRRGGHGLHGLGKERGARTGLPRELPGTQPPTWRGVGTGEDAILKLLLGGHGRKQSLGEAWWAVCGNRPSWEHEVNSDDQAWDLHAREQNSSAQPRPNSSQAG